MKLTYLDYHVLTGRAREVDDQTKLDVIDEILSELHSSSHKTDGARLNGVVEAIKFVLKIGETENDQRNEE